MQNVLLIVLLLLALALIGVVLLQRSEGGGMGMGGGGGGGAMGQRAQATALTRLTWVFGASFMVISLALTVLAARDVEGTSVVDRIGGGSATTQSDDGAPAPLDTDSLLPPPSADGGDAPAVPRAD